MHHHMYKRFIFLFVSINHPIIFGNHKTTKTSKFRSHLNVGNKIHRTIRYIANKSIPIMGLATQLHRASPRHYFATSDNHSSFASPKRRRVTIIVKTKQAFSESEKHEVRK